MAEYRIKRRSCGDYEVHRKVGWIFWRHDAGQRRLKSHDRSTYFKYWYDTYEQAKNGVSARMEFDQKATAEGGLLGEKIINRPFPESDI